VLCDSAPLLTAVYSVHYFDDHSLLAPALAHHRLYAATLVLRPDLPWIADGIQRDGAPVRAAVDALLACHLDAAAITAHAVAGHGRARLDAALAALRAVDAARAGFDARSTPPAALR